jgi:hypothetical protein
MTEQNEKDRPLRPSVVGIGTGKPAYEPHPSASPVDQLKDEEDRLRRVIAQLEERVRFLGQDILAVEQITLYLRDYYAQEIRDGRHGSRPLGDVVVHYLSLERMYSRMGAWKLIWRIITGQRGGRGGGYA